MQRTIRGHVQNVDLGDLVGQKPVGSGIVGVAEPGFGWFTAGVVVASLNKS